jgi:dTDP-4-amino-4,6-dideoxygalactose transaminase
MKQGSLPIAEQAALEVLSLPMYPELSEEQIRTVAEAVKKAL